MHQCTAKSEIVSSHMSHKDEAEKSSLICRAEVGWRAQLYKRLLSLTPCDDPPLVETAPFSSLGQAPYLLWLHCKPLPPHQRLPHCHLCTELSFYLSCPLGLSVCFWSGSKLHCLIPVTPCRPVSGCWSRFEMSLLTPADCCCHFW